MSKVVEEKIIEKLFELVNPGPKQTVAINESLKMDLDENVHDVIASIKKNKNFSLESWLKNFYFTFEPLARTFIVHVLVAFLEKKEEQDDVQRKLFKDAGGKEGEACVLQIEEGESFCITTPICNPDYKPTLADMREMEKLKILHEMIVYHPPYE